MQLQQSRKRWIDIPVWAEEEGPGHWKDSGAHKRSLRRFDPVCMRGTIWSRFEVHLEGAKERMKTVGQGNSVAGMVNFHPVDYMSYTWIEHVENLKCRFLRVGLSIMISDL